MVALWLLMCVMTAIDRRTIQTEQVGLVLDGAIALSSAELANFGFTRAVGVQAIAATTTHC
jgi:hypothetical protein